jgi:hypothetical protein
MAKVPGSKKKRKKQSGKGGSKAEAAARRERPVEPPAESPAAEGPAAAKSYADKERVKAGRMTPRLKKVLVATLSVLLLFVPSALMYAYEAIAPYKAPAVTDQAAGLGSTPEATTIEDTDYRMAFKQPLPAPWVKIDDAALKAAVESTGNTEIPDFGYMYKDTGQTVGGVVLLAFHDQPTEGSLQLLFPEDRTGTREEFTAYYNENKEKIANGLLAAQPATATSLFPSQSVAPYWADYCDKPMYVCTSEALAGSQGTGSVGAVVVLEQDDNLFFLVYTVFTPVDLRFIQDNLYFTR